VSQLVVKSKLASLTLDQGVFLKEQEGSVRKHMAEDFAEGALVVIQVLREVREDHQQSY
jgi:hypothetical protein